MMVDGSLGGVSGYSRIGRYAGFYLSEAEW